MTQLSEHPSVKRFYEARTKLGEMPTHRVLDAAWLRGAGSGFIRCGRRTNVRKSGLHLANTASVVPSVMPRNSETLCCSSLERTSSCLCTTILTSLAPTRLKS